jgi:hypothetical protein
MLTNEGVDSVHTLVWDSVVPASDWAGLGMFSGEWRIFRGSGWFESHLGHVFSLFRGL